MTIPLVDLKAQYRSIRGEIDDAIRRVVDSTAFILGEEVSSFETEFARYCGAQYAVGVASGTSALHLALLACGVGPGDEVITTPFTFIATIEPIIHVGATPVFADIDLRTCNIDPANIERLLTPRTKAIMPVHLYGRPADMGPMQAMAREHGLRVIEDAAQAHGASYDGKRTGTLGDIACFSFYPGKNLGAYGDAGAVVTDDADLAGRVRLLRDHGRQSKYEHQEIGFGERLDALQAAILRVKLRHLDEWNEMRRRHAQVYSELLSRCDAALPGDVEPARSVYHLYVIRTPRRDVLLARLKGKGVAAGVHYPVPLHRQPALLKRGYGSVSLPLSEQAAAQVLSLPLFPELTSEELAHVADAVTEYLAPRKAHANREIS